MGHWTRVALSGSNAHFRTLTGSALTLTQSVHTAVVTYDTSFATDNEQYFFKRTGSYGFMGQDPDSNAFPFEGDVFISASGTTTTRSINIGKDRNTGGSASLYLTNQNTELEDIYTFRIMANTQLAGTVASDNVDMAFKTYPANFVITGSFPNGISASFPSLPLTRSQGQLIQSFGVSNQSFNFQNPSNVVNNVLGTKFSGSAAQIYTIQHPKMLIGDDGAPVADSSRIRAIKIYVTCSLNGSVTSEEQPSIRLGLTDVSSPNIVADSVSDLFAFFTGTSNINDIIQATSSYSSSKTFFGAGISQRCMNLNVGNDVGSYPSSFGISKLTLIIGTPNAALNPANREIQLEGIQAEYFTIPDYPLDTFLNSNFTSSGDFMVSVKNDFFGGFGNQGIFPFFAVRKSGALEAPFIANTSTGGNEIKYQRFISPPPFPPVDTPALAYYASSKKLKTNIKPINSSLIKAFSKLKPVTYIPNKEKNNANALPIGGFIAEECGDAHPLFAVWDESSSIDIDERTILSTAVAKLQILDTELNNL